MERDEGEGDIDEGDETPLQRLAEAIDERAMRGTDRDAPSKTPSTDPGLDNVWGRLTGAGSSQTSTPQVDRRGRGQSNQPRGKIISYPSRSVLLIHSSLTGVTLIGSIILYLLTELGVLAEHLWVIALPFFAIGLLGAIPILSRWLRIWQPQELR